jgi:hypothetical protein
MDGEGRLEKTKKLPNGTDGVLVPVSDEVEVVLTGLRNDGDSTWDGNVEPGEEGQKFRGGRRWVLRKRGSERGPTTREERSQCRKRECGRCTGGVCVCVRQTAKRERREWESTVPWYLPC